MNEMKLDPSEVQKAIRNLESMDLEKQTLVQIEEVLTPLFRGYSVEAPVFDPGVYLCRARICKKPARLSDLSYPPHNSVMRLGRANDVGQSVFYAATARNVPFFELDVAPGDVVALSHWKTTAPLLLNHIGFSSESSTSLKSKRNLDAIYSFAANTRSRGDLNALVYDYLAEKFSRKIDGTNPHAYKLTVAISRKLLGNGPFLGILYPTVEMSGNADNVALTKDAADRALKFVSVEYVQVKSVKEGTYDIEVLDSASKVDLIGTLLWSGRRLQWQVPSKDQLKIISNGLEWLAYDKYGQRVDPQ